MAKFAELTRGPRARRRAVPFRTLEGEEVLVDLQLIGGAGQASILEYAARFATSRGCPAKDGDPVYEFGRALMTAALGTLAHVPAGDGADPTVTAPGEPAELFFSSVDETLEACDPDRALLLATHQRLLQERVSPIRRSMTDEEYWVHLALMAESEEAEEPAFFATWAPSMRWSFQRTTAQRFVASLASLASQTPKSSTTSSGEAEPSDGSPTSAAPVTH